MNSTFLMLNHSVLRSPEGEEAGGSGEVVTQDQVSATLDEPATENEEVGQAEQNEQNLFDFESVDDGNDSQEETDDQAEADGDYSLDFGESFTGTDEERAMITSKAKECGISAEAASSFVSQVLDELNESRIEYERSQLANLREAWGNKFDSNMRETKRFIKELTAKENFPEDTLQFLKTPHAFRLANAIRTRMSESGTKGFANAAAQASRQQQIDDFNNNPNNQYHKILSNPLNSHTEDYKKAARHINALIGTNVF